MKSLFLAAALAAFGPEQGPAAKAWLDAVVDGKAVKVLGWYEAGMVRFWPQDNAHLGAPAPAPAPAPSPFPGTVIEAGGTLNSGVQVKGLKNHAHQLDTNDPAFAREFYRPEDPGHDHAGGDRCPGPGPCPKPDPDPNPDAPDAPAPHAGPNPFAVPGAIVGAALILGLFGLARNRGAHPR